ncbi:MAG: type II secretion system F family protein [Myxococcota bacterium]
MTVVVSILVGILSIAVAIGLGSTTARSGRVRARLFAGDAPRASVRPGPVRAEAARPLVRWLARAGHRGPSAVGAFSIACFLFALAGGIAVWALLATGLAEQTARVFEGLPVMGAGLGTFFRHSPWLVGGAIAAVPIVHVRRDRARRIASIDQDLPLVIELLATLAEAGLGFESAMAEVLDAQPRGRALAEDLRLFQLEVSAGDRRSDALRRLADRIDLPAMDAFTSVLIHGEETGSSIAGTLRPQARQVRQERRERALARAEALPEKLVLPLLLGFLPGLLVWTLGPAFFQLFGMLDAALS